MSGSLHCDGPNHPLILFVEDVQAFRRRSHKGGEVGTDRIDMRPSIQTFQSLGVSLLSYKSMELSTADRKSVV